MAFCPNKNIQEWKDLVQAVGENKAYYLWHSNNGNPLSLNSDGTPNSFYDQKLTQLGDTISALKATAEYFFADMMFVQYEDNQDSSDFSIGANNSLIGKPVSYNGSLYLVWNINESSKAQLIDLSTGQKFSGTPNPENLTLVTNGPKYVTVDYNNQKYIVAGITNRIFSLQTGNEVYTSFDNSSVVQKERILTLAAPELLKLYQNKNNDESKEVEIQNPYETVEIEKSPSQFGFSWNAEQQDAIDRATAFLDGELSGDMFVIEGKAGTGKTTIARAILSKYKNKRVVIGALSNVATGVIRDSVRKELPNAQFKSVAAMLGMKKNEETGIFEKNFNVETPLDYADIIVIDEASMIGEYELQMIRENKKRSAKILFLGDIGQLAPVRTTDNPFYKDKKSTFSKKSPVFYTVPDTNKAKLVTRVRQGEGSVILPFADFYWDNSQAENPKSNPASVEARNTQVNNTGAIIFQNKSGDVIAEAVNAYRKAIDDKNPNLIKVVTYKNDTRQNINARIHNEIFGQNAVKWNEGEPIIFNAPYGELADNGTLSHIVSSSPTIVEVENKSFHAYDIVVPVRDENGEIKEIEIQVLADEDKQEYANLIAKLFDDAKKARARGDRNAGRMFVKAFQLKDQFFANIDYAYAITSHKSQGSTYDMVIVHEQDIMNVTGPSIINKSESVYTGLTRARNITVVISSVPIKDDVLPDLVKLNETIKSSKESPTTPPSGGITPDTTSEDILSEIVQSNDPEYVPWQTEEEVASAEEVNEVFSEQEVIPLWEANEREFEGTRTSYENPNPLTPESQKSSQEQIEEKPVSQNITSIVNLVSEYNDSFIRESLAKNTIEGLTPTQQYKLVNSLSYYINDELSNGNKSAIKDVIDDYFDSISPLKESVKSNPKHVAIFEAIERNRAKLESEVKKHIQKIRNVKLKFEDEIGEDVTIEDQNSNERTDFSDNYSISVNHKNTASEKLKMFFASIVNQKADGSQETNMFGLPEIIPFDVVYNNVQAALSGSRPDYLSMITKLESLSQAKPFFKSVVKALNEAPLDIRNQFVENMTKHAIEMEFLMWSEETTYDPQTRRSVKTGGYKFEIYGANSSSIERVIISDWKSSLKGKSIFDINVEDGESYFKSDFIDSFTSQFDDWTKSITSGQKQSYNLTSIVSSGLTTDLMSSLQQGFIPETYSLVANQNVKVKEGTIFRVAVSGKAFDGIVENGSLILSEYTEPRSGLPNAQELQTWLSEIGITMSIPAIDKLIQGQVYFAVSKGKPSYKKLFQEGGAFQILVKNLKDRKVNNKSLEEDNPLDDTIVKDLARTQVPFAINSFDSSFRTGGKSVATFTNNNFLINRMRELKDFDSLTLDKVMRNPFSKSNFLLRHFVEEKDGVFKPIINEGYEATTVRYLALESFKKRSAKPRANREFHNLSPIEREIERLNLFLANGNKPYNMNGEAVRNATMIMPTMSDKTRVMLMKFQARVFDVTSDFKISRSDAEYLFKYLVQPEIDRMKGFNSGINADIANYNPNKFYFIPSLNNIKDIILNGKVNPVLEVAGSELRESVLNQLIEDLQKEMQAKNLAWNTVGIISKKGNIFNSAYVKNVAKGKTQNVIADYVINSMLLNAGIYQSIIGDPALYEKGNIASTFDNIGKRLAMLIAPGSELPNSENLTFRVAVLKDTKLTSDFQDYFKSLGYDYSGINSGDAQEYTTWKEHLRVLRLRGMITNSEETEIGNYIKDGKNIPDNLLKVILKPLKPVYVYSKFNNTGFERRFYIKSSSIPLIPQLTKGFEIDKLRIAMESQVDRVVYESAMKVGINKMDSVFNQDGTVKDNIVFQSVEELPYAGYRIQQEIPNKDKTQINIGTQERSMLFLNFDKIDGFVYEGMSYNGRALKSIYNNLYKQLYQLGRKRLVDEITTDGVTINLKKLQQVLVAEGYSRGYADNIIESFALSKDSSGRDRFAMPLWLSVHSDKIEALLNSIVKNRVIKQKMPGMSLVLASENGFKLVSNEEQSSLFSNKIKLTDRFTDTLKPQRIENGVVKPAQVLVPERLFYKGSKVNLSDFMENGIINTSKLPAELFELFGFRIPTQGHNSMAYIEIVGFIPESMGDVVIAPKEFVKQMGSDFDVDKLYSYVRPTFVHNGEVLPVNDQNKKAFLDSKRESFKRALKLTVDNIGNSSKESLLAGEITEEEDSTLMDFITDILLSIDHSNNLENKVVSLIKEYNLPPSVVSQIEKILLDKQDEQILLEKFEEILLKSKIFDIHMSVMKNPDSKVQAQIAQPLEYGLLQNDDKTGLDVTISNLKAERGQSTNKPFLPLSESYQEEKFTGATAGKAGTGVFSLAAVFNSAVQSDEIQDAIYSTKKEYDDSGKAKTVIYKPTLFDKTSNGNIAKSTLIGSNRSKSEVIAAFQSASVDNEKQRILEKLNINQETFGVINFLAMHGFDEEYISVFINQPAIEEFVKLSVSLTSTLDGYNPNGEIEAYKEIKKKYGDIASEQGTDLNSAKEMIAGRGGESFNSLQLYYLNLFLDLKANGALMQQVMTTLNSDSKGIPISITETGDKVSKIVELPFLSNKMVGFKGMERLVGNYEYDEFGNLISIDPTTIKGFASVYGTMSAYKMFNSLFPFSNAFIEKIVTDINTALGIPEGSSAWSTNRKRIFDDMKAYLYSTNSNIYKAGVRKLRVDLLGDSDSHQSLASFMNTIKDSNYVLTHPFLSKLKPDLATKNASFAYINYNAASNENLDETLMYDSFKQMFLDNETVIGKRNGIEYTPKMLAEDLVAYSFLIGGTQNAKSFVKYIPTSYLRAVGFGDHLNSINIEEALGLEDLGTFATQFIQNNPQLVPEVSLDSVELNDKEPSKVTGLKLKEVFVKDYASKNASLPSFVRIRTSDKSTQIFKASQNGMYDRIPILGEKLSSEYYPMKDLPRSIIVKNNPPKIEKPKTSEEDMAITIERDYFSGEVEVEDQYFAALNNVKSSPYYSTLGSIIASRLKGFDIEVEFPDVIPFSDTVLMNPEAMKIIQEKNILSALGSFNPSKKRLRIGKLAFKSTADFERALLHESIHALTSGVLIRVEKGRSASQNEIDFYNGIMEVYNHAKSKVPNSNELYAFVNVREFIAAVMTEPDFQKLLNSIPSKQRNTILDDIVDLLTELIKGFGIEVNSNSVLRESLDQIVKYISVEDFRIPSSTVEDIDNSISMIDGKMVNSFSNLIELPYIIKENPTSKIKYLCQ